jgi:uncharacterized membrane protein (DUF485 family)
MKADMAGRIRNNPDFVELEAKRGRFSWTVAIIMLVIYYGFIALVAFAKPFMAMDIGSGMTLAFPLGLAVIASAVILTGVYVLRANGDYDRLTARIRESVR